MPQSTPLENIESNDVPDSGNASDSERVQRIIQEMSRGGDESPGEEQHTPNYQPQQQMHSQPQYQMPPPQQQQPQMGYHMYQPPNMMPPQPMMGPGMVPYHQQQEVQQRQAYYEQEQEPREEKPVAPPAKKNMWAHITDALKMPFVVACVFFFLSLPVVDLYLSKYAHWAFSSGGQLSLAGIGLKAIVAASIIGVYDTLDNLISRFL